MELLIAGMGVLVTVLVVVGMVLMTPRNLETPPARRRVPSGRERATTAPDQG